MGKHLNKLKLSADCRPKEYEKAIYRRRKNLLDRLNEQLELIQAELNGTDYQKERLVYEDTADGVRKLVSKKTPLKAWYWCAENGNWCIELRYRNRAIDLGRKRKTIIVGDKKKIPETIKLLIEAITEGELDRALAQAANNDVK